MLAIVTKFGSYCGKISFKYLGPSCSLIAPKNNSESQPPCSSHAIIVDKATISKGSKIGKLFILNNLNSKGKSFGSNSWTYVFIPSHVSSRCLMISEGIFSNVFFAIFSNPSVLKNLSSAKSVSFKTKLN